MDYIPLLGVTLNVTHQFNVQLSSLYNVSGSELIMKIYERLPLIQMHFSYSLWLEALTSLFSCEKGTLFDSMFS